MRAFQIIFCILPVLLALCWMTAVGNRQGGLAVRPAAHGPSKHSSPLAMQGLRATTHTAGRLQCAAKVDSLAVGQRKFLVFGIRPLAELTASDAAIDLYEYGNRAAQPDSLGIFRELLFPENRDCGARGGRSQIGLITRGTICGLTLKVYRNNSLFRLISASNAVLDFKNNEMKMKNFRMENPSSKEVTVSREAILHNGDNTIRVAGAYAIMSPSGFSRGRDLTFKL